MSLVIMGALANSLILVIISIFLILVLPTIRWVYRYYQIIKRVSLDDAWLDDPKSRKITYGQISFRKAVIYGLRKFSRVKKILILVLISIIILSIVWLEWDTHSPRYYGRGVYNSDTRVFTYSVNSDIMEASIKGIHDISLDIRQCRVGCLVFYENQNKSRLQMTACWNLTYRLYAGILGDAIISVEYWLFDDEADSLDAVSVYPVIITDGTVVNSTIQQKSAEFNRVCQPDSSYYVGVMLEVILSGFSSVEGMLPDTPATLKVYNITIQEV